MSVELLQLPGIRLNWLVINTTAWKVLVFGEFIVLTFPHLDHKNSEYRHAVYIIATCVHNRNIFFNTGTSNHERGETFCSMLVARYVLLLASYLLLVAHYFFLVARLVILKNFFFSKCKQKALYINLYRKFNLWIT